MTNSVIGALRINLTADTAEFKRKLTLAERDAERLGRAIGSTLRTGVLALASGAAAGAAALTALTVSSFSTISAQVDLAKRVGASVAAIQTLQYQTELAGGSSEALAKALGMLNVKLGEAARKGAGPAYEAVERLGLSIQVLSEMDADERIKAISDRMTELGYSTQQQADTLRSLGINQQEIINLFQEGSKAIDDARAELQAWGVLLSDVDAAKVEMAGDAWDKLKTVMVGVGNQIAIRVAPLIMAISDSISDAAKETGGFGSAIDKTISMGVHFFGLLQRSVYDFRIELDEAIAEILNLFDAVAGAPANLLTKIFGGTPEEWGFEKVNKEFGILKDSLAAPPSNEKLDQWLAEYRKKFEEAAAISARTKVTGGGVGESDDEKKTREGGEKDQENYKEKLAQKLATLQESLLTEREAELASYDQSLLDLENFHNQGLISDSEYLDLLNRNKSGHADRMKEIDDEVTKNQIRNFQQQADSWLDIASTIGGALESLFGESKALAIAQAIINTAQAITRTLAEYGATPLGFAAAAAAAAAGAAQIAAISRTQKTSKGGGSSANLPSSVPSGGSSPSQSPQAGSNQTLFINGISPGQLYSGESMRQLAAAMIEFQRDGGKIVLGNA